LGRCHTFLVGWVFASHVIAAALVQFHDSWRADNLRGTSGDQELVEGLEKASNRWR
jgi:hypothetical protein